MLDVGTFSIHIQVRIIDKKYDDGAILLNISSGALKEDCKVNCEFLSI